MASSHKRSFEEGEEGGGGQQQQHKRPRRLLGLVQDHDPRAYRAWRRYAQESSLLYTIARDQRQHACWEHWEQVLELPWRRRLPAHRGFEQAVFFACLGCGRHHACHPPDYLTCPRVSAGPFSDAFVCPFSGRELAAFEAPRVPLSFKEQARAFDAMAPAPRKEEGKIHVGGMTLGRRVEMRLLYQANAQKTMGQRRRVAKQAQQLRHLRYFFRQYWQTRKKASTRLPPPSSSSSPPPKKKEEEEEDEKEEEEEEDPAWQHWPASPKQEEEGDEGEEDEAERLRLRVQQELYDAMWSRGHVAGEEEEDGEDGNHHDRKKSWAEDGGGGGGDHHHHHHYHYDDADENEAHFASIHTRSFSDMSGGGQTLPTVIPQIEQEEDDGYLRAELNPVMNYIHAHVQWSVFGPLPAEAAAAAAATTPEEPIADASSLPPALAMVEIRSRNLWHPLRFNSPWGDFLPHQRAVVDHIEFFLSHYWPLYADQQTRRPTLAPQVMPLAVFCDRLLWVYHYHTGKRKEPNNPYWPVSASSREVARLVFVILTGLLTHRGMGRDSVTGVSIPIWLSHGWLTALFRQGLLVPELAPATLLTPAQAQTLDVAAFRVPLLGLLACVYFSPQALSLFLVPPH